MFVYNCNIRCSTWNVLSTLQWRNNERDGVSYLRRLGCLLNRLFGHRSKKIPKLRVTGLCGGIHRWPVNFPDRGPVTRKMFPFDDVIMGRFWNWNVVTLTIPYHQRRCWRLSPFRRRRFETHFLLWGFLCLESIFVCKVRINNNPALVDVMVLCRTGAKPLSEPMQIQFTTFILHHIENYISPKQFTAQRRREKTIN